QIWEISAHIGITSVDKVSHTARNKLTVPFLSLFVVEKNDSLFIANFSVQLVFTITQITDGLQLIGSCQLVVIQFYVLPQQQHPDIFDVFFLKRLLDPDGKTVTLKYVC